MVTRIPPALCASVVMSFIIQCAYAQERPMIEKRGTIDCDVVEATPLVFQGKLYRFEYVRGNYKPNTTGDSYFRFVDTVTGEATPAFAAGYHLGSAHVEGDTVYVYGVPTWGASTIDAFWSKDLATWRTQRAFTSAGWGIYNTGVCKGAGKYVMAIEIGEPPEETGVRFTIRFATSDDLLSWRATPPECVYSKEKYTACPAMAFLDDGFYYMIYLEDYGGTWDPHIIRSKDLVKWEDSPRNPIMKHSDEDKAIANPRLTPEQREHIAAAKNVNNSDVDFCEWEGKTVITYSWGDQHGTEFLAEAFYPGPVKALLQGHFPE
jgi:hypothetical protein